MLVHSSLLVGYSFQFHPPIIVASLCSTSAVGAPLLNNLTLEFFIIASRVSMVLQSWCNIAVALLLFNREVPCSVFVLEAYCPGLGYLVVFFRRSKQMLGQCVRGHHDVFLALHSGF